MTTFVAQAAARTNSALRLGSALVVLCLSGFLAACGGGGGGGSAATPTPTPTPTPAATLKSIAITPAAPTVAFAGTVQLTATGTYSDSTTKDLTTTVAWTSSATTIATVGASTGLVTAVAAGPTTITATSGTVSATDMVTVSAAALKSITVTPAAASIIKGTTTQQFTATGTYQDGSTKNITSVVAWASGTPTVATIGASTGLATGVAAGTSAITAYSILPGGTITSPPVTLTVTPPTLVSVAITQTTPTIAVGKSIQFTLTGTYSDGTTGPVTGAATWTSATPATATIVATTGVATGVALGTTSISAAYPGVAVPAPVILTVAATVYAYATNFDDNTVSQYVIGTPGTATAGTLTALSPATVAAGLEPFSVSVEPTGQYAYVANYKGNTVSEFRIGTNGTLSPIGAGTVPTGTEPNGVTIDPADAHAYVANFHDNTISQYTIGVSGELQTLGTPVATGPNPAAVTIDPSGKYAYVANYGANSLTPPATPQTISQYTVGANGVLTPMTAPTVASGAGPNAVVVTPTSTFAYAANTGDGTVSQYSIGAGGALTPILPAVAAGTKPFGLATDPAGKYLYVANSGDGTISQFTITAGTGVLVAIAPPAVVSGAAGSGVTSVTVDATGSYVYGTNRGTTTISQFSIGTNGALTPLTPTTAPAGLHPTSIATGY